MLRFDDETARMLDEGYAGSDVTRRRLANLAALAPVPGDVIADIGAGTGLLTVDLARAVGDRGRVLAIEPAADMRSTAAERCANRPNVRVLDGTADALPLEDGSVDRAVAIQVFEYIEDIPAALAEVHRVLGPSGRLVVGDVHWDSHVWHADDHERMARMLRLFDRHMVWRRLPARLPPMLRDAGFAVEAIVPEICQDNVFRGDGLAMLMTRLVSTYVKRNGLAADDEVDAWVDEQHRLAKQGRFFFALTHYVTVATRR